MLDAQPWIRSASSFALLLCLAVVPPALAQTPEAPDAAATTEAPAEQAAEEVDPRIATIEELRASLSEQREELGDVKRTLEGETGEDAVALRMRIAELQIENVGQIREFVSAVLELEAEGGDAAQYRQELEELLPSIAEPYPPYLESNLASLAKLETERDAAAPEEQVEIEQRIARKNDVVARMMEAGVDIHDCLADLGLDASGMRELLVAQLGERAELLSGRIELTIATLADAEERAAQSPDDAAIRADVAALGARLDTQTGSLESSVELMDRLAVDTASYKQLLIQSTGEITVDVFDREVAAGLIELWIDGMRESFVENAPAMLFRTIVFFLIVGVFWMLSRVVRKLTARAVDAPNLRLSLLLKRMIVSVASGAVLVFGLLVGLSQLGFQVGPLLAGLGIAGFIVGFALQDTLANFAAGIMILTYRPYDVGDLIDCAAGVFGKVSHMNLVSTTVLTLDNRTLVVPNGKIWGDVITNVTAQRHRRVDLVFGISYTDDIQHAEQVLWSILKKHPKVLEDPEPVVKVHELGDSSVNFVVRPWAPRDDYWDVHWNITREVKLRFDAEGISIPFPQRDVHFYPTSTNGSGAPPGPDFRASPGRATPLSGQGQPEND